MGFTGRMKAVEYTTRLLALDPLREEAHRKLMWLHALDGQRGAALAQYEACRQILDEELGVAPSGQTTTLYEQIRDGIPLQTEGDPEQGTFLVAPSE
jgi:DNA-binding SARP family transcriptional activator